MQRSWITDTPTPPCGRWNGISSTPSTSWPWSAICWRSVYGVSFVYIPAHQVRTNLTDTLKYLSRSKEDCVILVYTPIKPTFSPQPQRGKYYTMLPTNGDLDADLGPLGVFPAAILPVASREGCGGDMVVCIKLLPCYGSSKWPKTELIEESVLSRGPLWKNVHFVECNASGVIVPWKTGQTLCQFECPWV